MAKPRQRKPSQRATLEARFVKSALCRVIHVDGAIGGPTPTGSMIHCALYSERVKLPDGTRFVLNKDDHTAVEEGLIQQTSWVREIEADLIFTIDVARKLRDWLNGRIEFIENEKNLGEAFRIVKAGEK